MCDQPDEINNCEDACEVPTVWIVEAQQHRKWVTCLRVCVPPQYVTNPTTSTKACIPLGSKNQTPALIGRGKGGNVISGK